MTYEAYRRRALDRRDRLRQSLEQSNALRSDARLPIRDVEREIESIPLLSKEAYVANNRARRGFSRFRKDELSRYHIPDPSEAGDWQQVRAALYTRYFVESQIESQWGREGRSQHRATSSGVRT